MKKYSSKISYGLLSIILAVLFGTAIPMFSPPVWPGIIINLLVMLFVLHLFFTTTYAIDGNFLKIRSGFIVNKKIEINSIKKITESNSLISSPAASLDRLEVRFNKFDSILISPKDKFGFITDLTEINPQIEVCLKTK